MASIVQIMEELFKKLRKEFNQEGGPYWLPTQIENVTDPKLVPLTESSWNFTIDGSAGETFRNTIVKSWWQSIQKSGSENHQPIPDPSRPWPMLTLAPTGVITVNGLQNAVIGPQKSVEETGPLSFRASMDLTFGTYTSLPKVQLSSTYQLIQYCCSAPKAGPTDACDGFESYEVDGQGTVEISLEDMVAAAVVSFAIDGNTFTVDVEQVTITGQLHIDCLTIESPLKFLADSVWKQSATGAIESSEGEAAIFGQLTQVVNSGALSEISSVLQGRINDYLRANHEYPYGPPPTAAY